MAMGAATAWPSRVASGLIAVVLLVAVVLVEGLLLVEDAALLGTLAVEELVVDRPFLPGDLLLGPLESEN